MELFAHSWHVPMPILKHTGPKIISSNLKTMQSVQYNLPHDCCIIVTHAVVSLILNPSYSMAEVMSALSKLEKRTIKALFMCKSYWYQEYAKHLSQSIVVKIPGKHWSDDTNWNIFPSETNLNCSCKLDNLISLGCFLQLEIWYYFQAILGF